MKSYKNLQLISVLEYKIENMCGVGTKLVKLFLNKKVKDGDELAFLYRQLLECEMFNINAKRYNDTFRFSYRESYYKKKQEAIEFLINKLLDNNKFNIKFGYEESDVLDTEHIIYFNVPDCGQISFHTSIPLHLLSLMPQYDEPWDEQRNSTLHKLEQGILKNYGEEIKIKYAKQLQRKKEEEQRFLERLAAEKLKQQKMDNLLIKIQEAAEENPDIVKQIIEENKEFIKELNESRSLSFWKNISESIIKGYLKKYKVDILNHSENNEQKIYEIKEEIKNDYKQLSDNIILDYLNELLRDIYYFIQCGSIKYTKPSPLTEKFVKQISVSGKLLINANKIKFNYLMISNNKALINTALQSVYKYVWKRIMGHTEKIKKYENVKQKISEFLNNTQRDHILTIINALENKQKELP